MKKTILFFTISFFVSPLFALNDEALYLKACKEGIETSLKTLSKDTTFDKNKIDGDKICSDKLSSLKKEGKFNLERNSIVELACTYSIGYTQGYTKGDSSSSKVSEIASPQEHKLSTELINSCVKKVTL